MNENKWEEEDGGRAVFGSVRGRIESKKILKFRVKVLLGIQKNSRIPTCFLEFFWTQVTS